LAEERIVAGRSTWLDRPLGCLGLAWRWCRACGAQGPAHHLPTPDRNRTTEERIGCIRRC